MGPVLTANVLERIELARIVICLAMVNARTNLVALHPSPNSSGWCALILVVLAARGATLSASDRMTCLFFDPTWLHIVLLDLSRHRSGWSLPSLACALCARSR